MYSESFSFSTVFLILDNLTLTSLGHGQFNAQFMFPVKVVHWLSEKPKQDHDKKMKVALSLRKP